MEYVFNSSPDTLVLFLLFQNKEETVLSIPKKHTSTKMDTEKERKLDKQRE